MAGGIKRRGYDASGRRARARATRRAVVAAARELLEERGYQRTTVAEVARRAGVSPETVYKGFGGKSALIKAVVDVAIGGDEEELPVAQQPAALAIRAEPDPAEKLRRYAQDAGPRQRRSARLQLVLRAGADADPAVRELWEAIQAERLLGMTMLARHLEGTGGLRCGVEEARDVLWTCISAEVYDLLVRQRGWSDGQYVEWLTRTLIASLVAVPGEEA